MLVLCNKLGSADVARDSKLRSETREGNHDRIGGLK